MLVIPAKAGIQRRQFHLGNNATAGYWIPAPRLRGGETLHGNDAFKTHQQSRRTPAAARVMFARLTHNLGTLKACLLLALTGLFWLICLMRIVDDKALDMLLSWSSGLLIAITLMPVIRKNRLVYHALISVVWVVFIAAAAYAKTLPRADRDVVAVLGILPPASFYCHSALWVYGRYDMPRTWEEFWDRWRRDRTGEVDDSPSEVVDGDQSRPA